MAVLNKMSNTGLRQGSNCGSLLGHCNIGVCESTHYEENDTKCLRAMDVGLPCSTTLILATVVVLLRRLL